MFFVILVVLLILGAPHAMMVVNAILLPSEAAVITIVREDLEARIIGFKR